MTQRTIDFESPPHNGTATSIAAAKSIEPKVGTDRAKVLGHIRWQRQYGATRDEIEIALGLRHQTGSARVYDLIKAGFCVEGPDKRPTRSGHDAFVVRAREFAR